MLGIAVHIDAPNATDASPLRLTMTLDPSALHGIDPSTIHIFENGSAAAQWCASNTGPIDPSTDPCEVKPPAVDPVTRVVTFTVLTTQASVWTFGVTAGFAISTGSLPGATRGAAYGPVTLQQSGAGISATGYTTTFKWKKVTLPKGLTLSAAGVLSGTPSKKLAANPQGTITVQVTETVTTLNGKKKVKTNTTVPATIPLPIA